MHTRVQVESSNLESIGYNRKTKILEVEFKNGGLYNYFEVPIEVYVDLMTAGSHGKFFCAHIRNEFDYENVTDKEHLDKFELQEE